MKETKPHAQEPTPKPATPYKPQTSQPSPHPERRGGNIPAGWPKKEKK